MYLSYYGYPVSTGYVGRMPTGELIIFPTEREYIESFNEMINDSEEKNKED